MKVLAITARADIGGGPEHLFQLTRAYGDRASVTIACPNDAPYFARFTRLNNVTKVIEIPHRAFRLPVLWQLRRAVLAGRIDVIHSHGKGAGIYGRLLAALTGVPCVHTFHGLHVGDYGAAKRKAYLTIERMLGWATRAAICVSDGEATQIRTAGFLPDAKIHVVANGVEVPGALPARDGPQDPLRIVAVSRFDHQKNPMMLVDIAQVLRDEIGNTFTLDVMGQGAQSDDVQARIDAEELGDQMRLIGPTATPRITLQKADVFLSTSRWEGMPLAVLEAMSEGVVPVVTDVVGNRDVVEGGQTGVLYPLGDPIAGAKAILTASTNWNHLRSQAYDRVSQHYSVNRMADETLALTRCVTGR